MELHSFTDPKWEVIFARTLNIIIRMIKNRASGFRTVDAFVDLIYLAIGDVDIPAQIPNDSIRSNTPLRHRQDLDLNDIRT